MEVKANGDQNSRFESVGEFFFDGAFKERCTVLAEQFSSAVHLLSFSLSNEDYILKWLNFILENIISK
jgi:hypothetical protein